MKSPVRRDVIGIRGSEDSHVLVTGGCGFVGTNLAHRLMTEGTPVCVFDNLSRPGVERNLEWLRKEHGDLLRVRVSDIRDAATVREAVARSRQVFHLAAQVAVTTSLHDPVSDFEVNARGTLNLLEAVRTSRHRPPVFFTSTNKVYGGLDDVELTETNARYEPADPGSANGISEERPIDFHSPYGCSKGTADQYVLDYARSYGLQTVVFRMSCVYGPHQFGTEDQGWVAHFLIRALNRERIVVYGDGKQVRDLLYVDDLVDCFLRAAENIDAITGQAFNIGGGPDNAASLREILNLIGTLDGRQPKIETAAWRTGDQKYYVSDIRHFQKLTRWQPRVRPEAGVRDLRQWLIAAGVPAMVQRSEELAALAPAVGGRVRGFDGPVAAVPVAE